MNAARLALVLAPVLLVVPPAACSSSAPAAPDPAHADVVFQGTATDPALSAMLAVAPVDDPAHAAYFDNPKDLSEIPGAPIITFTWHEGQAAALRLLPPPRRRSLTGVVADLIGEREARAGAPEMSGEGYLLDFTVLDTGAPLFRVFTSGTSYTPDAAAWAKMATGTWTSLQITSASFAGDRLAPGSAPIRGQVVKFCIAWGGDGGT